MKNFDPKTMIKISAAREMIKSMPNIIDNRYVVRDTSGPNAFGYSFDIALQEHKKYICMNDDGTETPDKIWETISVIAESVDVYYPNATNNIGKKGAYGSAFLKSDIESIHDGAI